MPKVSIGVSTYNRRDYLRESLKSLLEQTYRDFEIIVVDDGSNDDTGEMVAHEFPQVRYFYKENGGDASAKNLAAVKAQGEYLVFNDSDDLFLPDALENLLQPLESHPEACSYGNYISIDAAGNRLPTRKKMATYPSGRILNEMLRHIIVCNTGFMIRTEEIRKLGGFDTSMKVAYDYKLLLEIAVEHDFFALNKPVFLRRRHGGNISQGSYDKIAIIESIIRDFVAENAKNTELDRKVVRRRLARLNEQLAREAQHENLGIEVVRKHLNEALKNKFSFKSLFRRILTH